MPAGTLLGATTLKPVIVREDSGMLGNGGTQHPPLELLERLELLAAESLLELPVSELSEVALLLLDPGTVLESPELLLLRAAGYSRMRAAAIMAAALVSMLGVYGRPPVTVDAGGRQ